MTALREEAAREGFQFLERLFADWTSGTNRFGGSGETFVGAFVGDRLVAVAGVNREPYDPAPSRARLRHLYVLRAFRRRGIATILVTHLLEEARKTFDEMRLRTDTAEAAAFYERIGFDPVQLETASHVRILRDDSRHG